MGKHKKDNRIVKNKPTFLSAFLFWFPVFCLRAVLSSAWMFGLHLKRIVKICSWKNTVDKYEKPGRELRREIEASPTSHLPTISGGPLPPLPCLTAYMHSP
ncbi:hypothetical protein FKM82_017976 [Ascaphus truei]